MADVLVGGPAAAGSHIGHRHHHSGLGRVQDLRPYLHHDERRARHGYRDPEHVCLQVGLRLFPVRRCNSCGLSFHDHGESGKDVPIDPQDSVEAVRLALAIIESAKSGERITLS